MDSANAAGGKELNSRHVSDDHSSCDCRGAIFTPGNGGCQVPIACYAELTNNGETLWLRGLVGKPDGSVILRAEAEASPAQAEELGDSVARDLLAQGAEAILAEVYAQ